ncbi:hypothetical protein ACWEFJ_31905 [Actinosynnema sp. NPDC004786]
MSTRRADRVRRCFETTDYAYRRPAEAGRDPQRAPHSTIVLFDAPPEPLCRRRHMITDGSRAQLVVMPHVTTRHIDRLCEEPADTGSGS